MNEEEIRGKLLLPFLNDLGIEISEISLETSFSIRLGKSEHKMSGRSDILCTRNGKNLFIIELKNDSISISQDDIDQGISYARMLTGNIAPFTVITNGKDTKIFDSISKEELTGREIAGQSNYWRNGYTLSSEEDLRIRYEALTNFISFSPENLKRFCESQIQERMGPIIGSIDNPYAKFIKELHVQRKDLQQSFDEFITSSSSVFGIVGAAGVGKTSVICSLALQKAQDSFVFFYNAGLLNKSPLEHISHDINGAFTGRIESDNILKKLDDLGKFIEKDILIFIDAVDENINQGLSLELSEIALAARNYGRIKVCVSCKTGVWESILKRNGTGTHLLEELTKTHGSSGVEGLPGFHLNDFTDEEMRSVIPLYKNVFGFKGDITESVFNTLRNGFFLRIFSEVYNNREIPETIDDKELIRTYIQRSLGNTQIDSQFALRVLSKIGKVLVNHHYKPIDRFYDNGIKVENLLDGLELSLGERIPEDLFSRHILIRSNNDDSYNVSFYYSKIRDYIISFHSFRLNQLTDDGFYNILETLYENHIGQSALSFYIENASHSHRQTVARFKRQKSLDYVTLYNNFLDKTFKVFKEKFDPKTFGDIGILLPHDLINRDGYALFHLDQGSSERVQFEELGDIFARSFDDSIFTKKGVKIFHGSNKEYLIANQDMIIRKQVFKQLREIIYKGKISVYTSNVLLLEQLSTILYYYSKRLGVNYDLKDLNLPRFDLIYPIDLKDLRTKLHRFRVTEHFKRDNLDPESRSQRIEDAVKNDVDIPRLNITGDFPPFEELLTIVDILLKRGFDIVENHHLPCPDITIDEVKAFCGDGPTDMWKMRTSQFSEYQAKHYIDTFLKHFDTCYKEFIEAAFPEIKEQLPFYKSTPHEFFVYMKDSSALKWGWLGSRKSQTGELTIHHKEWKEDIFSYRECDTLYTFSLDDIIHVDYNDRVKTIDGFRTDRLDEFCVLRNWVYKFLKSDMEKIFKEND